MLKYTLTIIPRKVTHQYTDLLIPIIIIISVHVINIIYFFYHVLHLSLLPNA